MAVRIKADDLGYALLLKGIETRDDAVYIRDFLIVNGLNPVISAVCEDGYVILLHGVSCDTFVNLPATADIQLM